MNKETENKTTKTKKVIETKDLITGTGRRKTAVARVFLWEEKGDLKINGVDATEYFPSEKEQSKLIKPFHLIGVSHPDARFNINIKVQGSGRTSQLGAVVHGISRALAKMSEEYHKLMAENGLLTRDSRMVERKKYFLHKARKRPQYSKR